MRIFPKISYQKGPLRDPFFFYILFIIMKLIDILLEGSADLKRVKKMFLDRWKKIMSAKGRQAKVNDVEKIVNELLTKDEVRLLVLQLQRNK